MKHLSIILSSVFLLAGCANESLKQPLTPAELAANKGYVIKAPIERIRQFRINGWQHINRQALILDASPTKKYLVTLRKSCHGLIGADLIATTALTATLSRFDSIIVRDHSHTSRHRRYCHIDEIYRLNKKPKPKNETFNLEQLALM